MSNEHKQENESCEVNYLTITGMPQPINDSLLLADHTTLRIGGPARQLVIADTQTKLINTVLDCDRRGEPVLILSGGSNLLISDQGFDGTVVLVATRGISAEVSFCGGAVVTVAAGESWDGFVQQAIKQEWSGVEALSGIPGLVGATPIQNVGAYGQDVSQTIYAVRTLDRRTGQLQTFALTDCRFSYRNSRFKAELGRYLVIEVLYQFTLGTLSAPIGYAELARRLGIQVGQRADMKAVRDTVLAIRAEKGMVLDPQDHDTWSAGSFFTNPIVPDSVKLPAEVPRFPLDDGRVKVSAAWLIEHAGFGKGYGDGRASLSTKHTLAITNRGGARAEDVLRLANQIKAGVQKCFGIELQPEPTLIGIKI